VQPDLMKISQLPARGLIVTSKSDDPSIDFLSRFFAPAVGVPEDPVTGSAHCALAPYWGQKLGKQSMVGYQCSLRGGEVRVVHQGDRVALSGQAVLMSQIDLLVDNL
jgi:predicted PhzF superfamily epimerase YddE/YHI9